MWRETGAWVIVRNAIPRKGEPLPVLTLTLILEYMPMASVEATKATVDLNYGQF